MVDTPDCSLQIYSVSSGLSYSSSELKKGWLSACAAVNLSYLWIFSMPYGSLITYIEKI